MNFSRTVDTEKRFGARGLTIFQHQRIFFFVLEGAEIGDDAHLEISNIEIAGRILFLRKCRGGKQYKAHDRKNVSA